MIDVVIVSYNTGELLGRCLDSLATGSVPVRVVVVDNDSRDDSVRIARSHRLAPLVVENDANLGFAKAVNQALDHVHGDTVLLLNPDTTVPAETLPVLLDALGGDGVVAVGPKVVHPAGRLRALSAGRQPTTWRMFTHYSGLSSLSHHRPWLEGWHLLAGVHDDTVRDVEWLSGACLLLRREALERVGRLSERWFMYAEDLDLCARLRAQGGRLLHVPQVHVTHLVGASSETSPGPVSTMWLTSTYDYIRREFRPSRPSLAAWRACVAAGLASRALVYRLRSLRSPQTPWRREARKFSAYARAARRLR